MIQIAVLGYPRVGPNRELKKATEGYWNGEIKLADLKEKARQIRLANWTIQKDLGIDIIPSNDFSFYDQMLDMSVLLGAIPPRYNWKGTNVDLDTYFSMARGVQAVPAMEMTKWFDTNYHYIVPEFYKNQSFKLSSDKPFVEFEEALKQGIKTRPVLIGPITYLMLGKVKEKSIVLFDLLKSLLPVYISILNKLKTLGADWVQIDEPILALDLDEKTKVAFSDVYKIINKEASGLNIILTTYFGALGENLNLLSSLPVNGIHVDLVRTPSQLDDVVKSIPEKVVLSLGVVDGRNVWKTNLEKVISYIEPKLTHKRRENLIIATSCSLLHTPLDLDLEDSLDSELKNWLAFAKQKL
ncbi:MAG: 5-methyltetrahydropteroyltriglutamate--homocysteine methyltransferase, partial [bacterium]